MKAARLFIPLFFLLLLSTVFVYSASAQSTSEEYLVLRSRTRTLYIANESLTIKVKPTLVREKPTTESVNIHIDIKGLNNNVSRETTFSAKSQTVQTRSLQSLPKGHYRIIIFAEKGDLQSQKSREEFGVFRAPVPYHISFRPGGTAIDFHSKKINKTGHLDPRYNFTLKIYRYQPLVAEDLIRTVKGVVDITIEVKESWRDGVILVNVHGPHGWINSMNMQGDSLQMQNPPERYNYDWRDSEPYQSKRWFKYPVVTGMGVAALVILMKADDKYGR